MIFLYKIQKITLMKSLSIPSVLIIFSLIATLWAHIDTRFFIFGLNRDFLDQGIYHIYVVQIFTSQFIHGWLLHLVFNSVFIYYFGTHVQYILWYRKFLIFFILNALFIAFGITIFWNPYINTVGISGFALAVLTYYTLHLRSIGNPEYTGGITAIVINILIGFSPQISFLGHFLGVVFWGIYYYTLEITKKRG